MRRLYSTSLIVLFLGILVAGAGLGFRSTLMFQIGAFLTLAAVVGVLVYAFRPKQREPRG